MTVYGPGAPKYGRGGRPLSRKKPLRAKPHSKGNRAEREVIDLLHDAGWTSARRNFQSGGQGGGDILNGPTDYHLEVKHRERAEIWKWLAQAELEARPTDTPALIFRRNHSRWWVAIPFDVLLELLSDE